MNQSPNPMEKKEKRSKHAQEQEMLQQIAANPNTPRVPRKRTVNGEKKTVEEIPSETVEKVTEKPQSESDINEIDEGQTPARVAVREKSPAKSRNRENASYARGVFRETKKNTFICLLRQEKLSVTSTHKSEVAGPVGNLWLHLGVWHPKAKSALEKAAVEGEHPDKVAETLKEAWKKSPSTKPMDRFLNVVLQKPGKVEKELALTIWAVDSSVSMNSFSSQHWTLLCEKLNVSLCGATTMMANRLPVIHHLVKKKITANLKDMETVAIAIDGWKSEGAQTGAGKLVGISYFYITDSHGLLQHKNHMDFCTRK
jgi:hypothetical protein